MNQFTNYVELQAEKAENLSFCRGIKLLHIRDKVETMLGFIGKGGIFVIEFKKKNAETYDKENDRNKLMYLTDQKEDFKYNFGLFVELGSHEVYMEVYQEGNLQTKLNYSITY